MTGHGESKGTAVICNSRGEIQGLVADGLNIFPEGADTLDLFARVDKASWNKLSTFLDHTQEHRTAMGWELNTLRGEDAVPLYFFGVAHEEDRFFVVVSPMPENIIYLYDQMIGVVNDQSVLLRTCQQKLRAAQEQNSGESGYDEFMRLNNELVNTQRELNIRNRLLVKQEERTRRLFDINPDALLILSEQAVPIAANHAARDLFMLADKDIGTIQLSVIDGEACIMQGDNPVMVESRSIRTTWDGKPATLVSLRDITERKELEALKEDVERISRHDIKSPLSGIIGLSELMADMGEGEMSEYAGHILDAARRTMNLINNSLSLYKMECDDYDFIPEPVELAPLLQRLIEDQRKLAAIREACVVLDGPIDAGDTIMGEPSLYETMFANLIKNALEASPKDGVVTIRWESDPIPKVSIHNQGAVPREIRKDFFRKYTTFGKRGGSGLGTYSARLIALTMGGTLTMDTDDATGTTLTYTLAPKPAHIC